jgi:hypothetical protein
MRFRKLLFLFCGIIKHFFICVLWSDNQLNMVLGKSTKVVDISSIVKPSEIIQSMCFQKIVVTSLKSRCDS